MNNKYFFSQKKHIRKILYSKFWDTKIKASKFEIGF
jgi:hypothetical protein